jgi:arginine:ornithine antiporter/lysine permease
MTDETASTHAPRTTVSMLTLSSFVVGSMVGAGVFSLPGTFAAQTGVFGSLVAWLVAGAGMFLLALVFQRLAQRRPELDAGVYSYARAGFGRYAGFLSAFGYWASARGKRPLLGAHHVDRGPSSPRSGTVTRRSRSPSRR